jgi:hypothetical protein
VRNGQHQFRRQVMDAPIQVGQLSPVEGRQPLVLFDVPVERDYGRGGVW